MAWWSLGVRKLKVGGGEGELNGFVPESAKGGMILNK
jgi:hypothetical protein